MNACEDCAHWCKKQPLWGDCDIAAVGDTTVYSRWCPEGRKAKHAQGRYKKQKACKTRFSKKGDMMAHIKMEYIKTQVSCLLCGHNASIECLEASENNGTLTGFCYSDCKDYKSKSGPENGFVEDCKYSQTKTSVVIEERNYKSFSFEEDEGLKIGKRFIRDCDILFLEIDDKVVIDKGGD